MNIPTTLLSEIVVPNYKYLEFINNIEGPSIILRLCIEYRLLLTNFYFLKIILSSLSKYRILRVYHRFLLWHTNMIDVHEYPKFCKCFITNKLNTHTQYADCYESRKLFSCDAKVKFSKI